MAAVPNSIRVVLSGTMYGSEVFAHGFSFDGTGIVGNSVAEDAFGGASLGYLTSALLTATHRAYYNTTTAWNRQRIYFYDGTGTLHRTTEDVIAFAGTAAAGCLPTQLAVVASLRTGLAGRANRGRSYLPNVATVALASGVVPQMSATATAAIANAVRNYVSGLGNDVDGGPAVVASLSQGAMVPITSIVVDSKLDVQRSRAQKIAATTTSTVAY